MGEYEPYDPAINVGTIVASLMDKITDLNNEADDIKRLLDSERDSHAKTRNLLAQTDSKYDLMASDYAILQGEIRMLKANYEDAEKDRKSLVAQVEQLTFRNKQVHDETLGERLKVGRLEEHLRSSEERSRYWQDLAKIRFADVKRLEDVVQSLNGKIKDLDSRAEVNANAAALAEAQVRDRDSQITELKASHPAPSEATGIISDLQAQVSHLNAVNEELRYALRTVRDTILVAARNV